MKAPSTAAAPAATSAGPAVSGIVGSHARAEVEGTTLRTISHIQFKDHLRIVVTAIIVVSAVNYGNSIINSDGTGNTLSLGEVGIWAAIVVFFYGAYLTFKSGAAALPKMFFTFGVILLLLLGAISYVFGPNAVDGLLQDARNLSSKTSTDEGASNINGAPQMLGDGNMIHTPKGGISRTWIEDSATVFADNYEDYCLNVSPSKTFLVLPTSPDLKLFTIQALSGKRTLVTITSKPKSACK